MDSTFRFISNLFPLTFPYGSLARLPFGILFCCGMFIETSRASQIFSFFAVVVYGLMHTDRAYFCYSTISGDSALKDVAPKYYSFHLPLHSLSLKYIYIPPGVSTKT